MKIREKALGADHPNVAQSCYNLALVLGKQGEVDKLIDTAAAAMNKKRSDFDEMLAERRKV